MNPRGAKLTVMLLAGGLLGGCIATSEQARLADEIDQVRSGQTSFLQRTFMTMDKSCASVRRPSGTLVETPKHGSVTMVTQNASAIYENDEYRHCHGKIGKALAFKYTAQPGYRGPDSFRVRIRYSDGEIRHARYNLNVY